ncbi:DUF2637 domain-containing protein [Amycolatopsis sp. lyj-84]|uniref:DUF2637 domain-containing protein n=1 Tax=Amycolatopsis sp. lyj-84 TaxID=2789284 RepID=UPI00397929B6
MASRVESGVRAVITTVVGLIGGAIGFVHTRTWAEQNGQHGLVAWGIAVVIESMVVVAGLELRRRYGHGPLVVLVLAFLFQMAAQVSSARDTLAGWLLAATPALGFLVIVKFALRAAADSAGEKPREDLPRPESVVEVPTQVTPLPESVVEAEVREIEPVPTSIEDKKPEPVGAGWGSTGNGW